MRKIFVFVLVFVAATAMSAEVILDSTEIAEIALQVPPGEDAQVISYDGNQCSFDLGPQQIVFDCTVASTEPQCSDGIDNDGDHLIDLADPGCTDSSDDDEYNVPLLAQCEDGVDNDGDGDIDMADAGCSSSEDDNELDDPPLGGGWPVGIPVPVFGLNEHVSDVDYTYWVDNSVTCSDSTNGTPANPRCSLPDVNLVAGDIVQIRGGPYLGSHANMEGTGTAAEPVYFRGSANTFTEFTVDEVRITGDYLIVENIGAMKIEYEGNYAAFRDVFVHDHPGTGASLYMAPFSTNVLIYSSEITRNGPIPRTSSKDRHGIVPDENTDKIWIIENVIHHNSGDGIQFGNNEGPDGPKAVYIGKNTFYADIENALDFKDFQGPVIVSENEMHSYTSDVHSGNGDAIRLNDESDPGNQGEVWYIRNHSHDNDIGMNPSGSVAESYAIDNILMNNQTNIYSSFTEQAGNVLDGVPDGNDPEPFYDLFESRFGMSIR